jgi:outer membrane biosynthesis protein TonB
VDLLLKEVPMSRVRTLAHVALTVAAIFLAVSWTASAVPLQAARPAPPAASITTSGDVKAPVEPKLVHKVNPSYPAEARAANVEGLVVLEVVIGKDGAIKEARVVASAPTSERLKELEPRKGTAAAIEGDARLATAALDAVKQWRYEPILMAGKPADFMATVTVRFKLS